MPDSVPFKSLEGASWFRNNTHRLASCAEAEEPSLARNSSPRHACSTCDIQVNLMRTSGIQLKLSTIFPKSFMHTLSVCLHLKEKSLEGGTGVLTHVFHLDMGQTVEQKQRKAANGLEPLATDEEGLIRFLSAPKHFTCI